MSYRHDRLNRHNRPNKHKDTPTVWADECIKKCLFCQPSSVHFQPFLVHEERRSGKMILILCDFVDSKDFCIDPVEADQEYECKTKSLGILTPGK